MIRIALIDIVDKINSDDREHLGLASIAAFLRRRGLTVDLLSFVLGEPFERRTEVDLASYDLCGFSIYPNTASEVFRYANEIKRAKRRTVVCIGGRLATTAAAEILLDCPSIDFSVLGDGEMPLLRAAEAIASGESLEALPSVFTRARYGGVQQIAAVDLSQIPWPARDFLAESAQKGNHTARLNTSIGCVASCTFCCVNDYHNLVRSGRDRRWTIQERQDRSSSRSFDQVMPRYKKWRARDVADVVDEIMWLNEEYGIRSFVFNDASFEDPGRPGKKRVKEMCGLLRERQAKFAFRCAVRAESFSSNDDALLDEMRSVGFTQFFVGVESGSDDDLSTYHKIAHTIDNKRALALFRRHDIDFTMGAIMLNPFSTASTIKDNYLFLRKEGAPVLNQFIGKLHIYFGAPLHKRLLDEQLLTPDFSYRNPFGYRFVDPWIQELDGFLQELRQDPVMERQSGKMYSLCYTMSELKALFGAGADKAFREFEGLRKESAAILAEHFAASLDGGDIDAARRGLDAFRAEVAHLSKQLDSFSLRLIYNPAFRQHLLRAKQSASESQGGSAPRRFIYQTASRRF